MIIDLAHVYRKFMHENNYDINRINDIIFEHWVTYRNEKFPKSKYIYSEPRKINGKYNDYNILKERND